MPRATFSSTSFSKWKRSSSSIVPSIFLLRNQDCNRSKNDMSFSRLFVSQRDQRIDARSPARGQKAGKRGDGTQNPGNGKEGDWIVRAHVEQLAGKQPCETQSQDEPEDHAQNHQPGALSRDQTYDVTAACAERHADPDLPSALRHPVGKHSINTDRRQCYGQSCKDHQQVHRCPARTERARNQFLHGGHVSDGLVFIHLMHNAPQLGQRRHRTAGRAQNHAAVRHVDLATSMLGVRDKDFRITSLIQSVLLHIADHADDRDPGALLEIGSGQLLVAAKAHAFPNGILSWKIASSEALIDEYDGRRSVIVEVGYVPPARKRYLHCAQVLRAYEVEIYRC